MLIASISVALLAAAFAGYRFWRRKRRTARHNARRIRNRAHQRAWDMFMGRPKAPRLTDQRKTD